MGIRRVAGDHDDIRGAEYAFTSSPQTEEARAKWRDSMRYNADNILLIAEQDGVSVAEVSAFPMRQNVRGTVYRMGGVAAVSAQPHVRRHGHIRALMRELHGQLRDEGHAFSVLYPFRASFYAKFGYVGLPKPRRATFDPAGLAELRDADLGGEVEWRPISAGYADYRALSERLLTQRHGFALFSDTRDVRIRDRDEHWLATAKKDGEVIGATAYRIEQNDEIVLDAASLLYSEPLGRSLLLQFFAMHVDHVRKAVVPVAPDDFPELWATDLAVRVEARRSPAAAPMGRVLSVEALRGMAVGPGRVGIEIVDDEFIGGKYVLDGTSGSLEVTSGDPEATLTAAGFAGLVHGVLSPADVVLRGLGVVASPSALDTLFPRQIPHVCTAF